jgi:hypothetical protein
MERFAHRSLSPGRSCIVAVSLVLAIVALQAGAAQSRNRMRAISTSNTSGQHPDDILLRAAEYVAGYQRAFSAVVSEERYVQTGTRYLWDPKGRVLGGGGTVRESRILRSDLLLLRMEGADFWQPFRDVYEVDGTPVRDREQRLQRLFLEAPGSALERATAISAESARYNLGVIERTINVPTMALAFIELANLHRSKFMKRDQEMIEGLSTYRVDFSESGRPTIIHTPGSGEDVPASGCIWIDAVTGRVAKTELHAKGKIPPQALTVTGTDVTMTSVVTYRPDPALGIWVPAQMREQYAYPTGTITGFATYSKFRRFVVTTAEDFNKVVK